MFKKIVVGLDGSETSEKALKIAADLASKYEAELHLVHTPQPSTVAFALGAVSGYHAATTMPSAIDVELAAEKILDLGTKIVESQDHTVAQTRVGHGDPADNIVEYAKENGADLIVTGRRGLGAIGALVMGSTSLRISHNATCACLTVV
jgi:nucleotide-binding universal stress UspA family protein